MKKICMLVLCVVALFSLTGCGNDEQEKKVLYKMSVEDVPYLHSNLLSYSVTDRYGNKVTFMMNDRSSNKCTYYSTKKQTGLLIQMNYKSCSYSVKDNNITIDTTVSKLTITNPNTFYENSLTTEETLTLTGKFHETGKELTLTIDGESKTLASADYTQAKDKLYLDEVLYDKNDKEIYTLDGLSIWKRGEEQQRVQLDLSKYEIREETLGHNLWTTNF